MVCLLVLVALNATAFGVRLWFVCRAGPYAATTGFEEFNLYAVWKVAHGYPLYEWPQRDHFMLTHYNFAYYYVYAAWTKLWHADGAALVNAARSLTPLFAMQGMLVQVHLLGRMLRTRDSKTSLWVWGLSFLTWFGPVFGGWWVLTVRPDEGAAALAVAGFALALRAQETRSIGGWLASSMFFLAAWAFKQYVIWIFVGTVGQALLARVAWRQMAALIAPFAGFALLIVGGVGGAYRYSLIDVPRFYSWFPLQFVIVPAVVANLFFWLWGGWGLWSGWFRSGTDEVGRGSPDSLAMRWRSTALAAIPPLGMGAIQASVPGSNVNNLLEGFVMLSLLGSAAWLRSSGRGATRWALIAGAISLVSMMPLPAVHLILAARGTPLYKVGGLSVGNVVKLTEPQLETRRRFAGWMQTLPKPLWICDSMLQLPWFATDNQFPAIIPENDFEDAAWKAGVLEGDGAAEWFARRYFACVLLKPSDDYLKWASAAGYMPTRPPRWLVRRTIPNEYGISQLPPIILLRPSSSTP